MKAKVSAHVVGVFVSLLFAIPVHAQTSEPACVIVVTPPTIAVGGSVTLRWDSTSTASGIISHIGAVPVRGSVTLTPSSGGKTTFAGTFFGPNGTTTCDASVTVGSSGSSGYTQSSYTQSTYGTGDVPDMTSYGTGDAPPNATGYSIGNKVPDATGYSIDQNSFKTQPNIGNFTNPAPGVTTGAAPPNNSTKGSLVPCGFEKSPSNPTSGTITPYNASATSCDVCSFAQLIQNLINFMLMLAIPIAAGLFAYAGILRFTSMGDTGKITKSSKIFLSVFVGFAIALSGYLIVQTLLNAFLAGGWSWTKLECTGNRERGSSIQEIFKGVLTTGQVGLTPGATPVSPTGVQPPATAGTGGGVQTISAKGLSGQEVQTSFSTTRSDTSLQSGYARSDGYGSQVESACSQYGSNIPDCRVKATAMMTVESSGNATAGSPVGAQGLMQLMPDTARTLGFNCNLSSDTQCNINAGVKYMSQMYTAVGGNDANMIAAYNAGPSAQPGKAFAPSQNCAGLVVWQCGTNPGGYTETQGHVANVCRAMALNNVPCK